MNHDEQEQPELANPVGSEYSTEPHRVHGRA